MNMAFVTDFFSTFDPIYLKLGCAVLAGAVLGLEREYNGHAAGLRTTILVCLVPAFAVLACGSLMESTALARITQGVFAGVGFIGGGVILKQDKTDTVRGVTTAAVLWMATTLGFVFGLGLFKLGFTGLGVGVFVVYVLAPVAHLFHTRHRATLTVTASDGALTAKQGAELLAKIGLKVVISSFDFNTATGVHVFRFAITYRHRDTPELPAMVRGAFGSLPGILHINWS